MSLTPTSELEAVNTMLNTIGEAPVNTLVNMTSVDALAALSVLHSVNRGVQVEGWFFNTEYDYPLVPDLDNNLPLPTNLMSVDSSEVSTKHDLVQRGSRAYDRKNHTYTFTDTVKCNLILLLAFEEIPEAARNYITLRASRILQDRLLGSDSLHGMNREDEYLALTSLRLIESQNADYNILTGNQDVYRIISR
jgi:hypothetical protein|tara:strand:+ start:47 stop:625 length:579 start_codon:yes stop_codon:yes gene_type:complete